MPGERENPTPEDLLKEASKAATKLLTALGNPQVVVVDDQVIPDATMFIAAYKDKRERATSLLPDTVAWDELEDDLWSEEVSTVFSSQLTGAQRRELHVKALRRLGTVPIDPLDVLQQILGDQTMFLLPDEWNARHEELVERHGGPSGLLVLFDRNLGVGLPNGGVELLSAYLQLHSDARAAILTDTVDPGKELDRRDSVVTDAAIRPRALLAAKGNLSPDGGLRFLNTIRLTANAPLLLQIRRHLLEHVQHTFGAAEAELNDIQPQVLEDIAFRSSRAEGAWEVDTLLRLVAVFQERAAREALRPSTTPRPEFLPLIEQARHLVQAVYVRHEPSTHRARELMAWERWHDADHINPIGLPLSNGDVFDVAGALYLLLCQPCDIALRSDGRRRSAHSLPLLPLEPRASVDEIPSDSRALHQLPAGYPTASAGLNVVFGRWLDVDSAVLDLCSFRTDGRAVYASDPEESLVPTPLTDGSVARRKTVNKLLATKLDQVNALSEVPRAKREQITKALLQADPAGRISHARNQSALTYRLKRVARLSTAYAEAALAAFSSERSRQAYDFDLDRFVA